MKYVVRIGRDASVFSDHSNVDIAFNQDQDLCKNIFTMSNHHLEINKTISDYLIYMLTLCVVPNFKFRINLADSKPVTHEPYTIKFNLKDRIKTTIKRLLDLRIIKHSTSPYSPP